MHYFVLCITCYIQRSFRNVGTASRRLLQPIPNTAAYLGDMSVSCRATRVAAPPAVELRSRVVVAQYATDVVLACSTHVCISLKLVHVWVRYSIVPVVD